MFRCIGFAMLLGMGCAWIRASDPAEDQAEAMNRVFAGKTVTAKMDLPLIRSVYVTPEGEIDQKRYRKRLLKQPPSILQGETAELKKIALKKDTLHLLINNGGVPGFAMGRSSSMLSSRKKAGSRIEIEFNRQVMPSDLTKEKILHAVRKVISIEGFDTPVAQVRPDEVFDTSTSASVPTAQPNPVAPSLQVHLLGAEVQPLKPRPGQQIVLNSMLEIIGGQSGQRVSVTLTRQLYFEHKPLFSEALTSTAQWSPGRHTATFSMNLPRTAEPGVYTYVTQIIEPVRTEPKQTLFVIE